MKNAITYLCCLLISAAALTCTGDDDNSGEQTPSDGGDTAQADADGGETRDGSSRDADATSAADATDGADTVSDAARDADASDDADSIDCSGMRVYDWTDLDDGVIDSSYFSDDHWGTNIHHDPESISVVSTEDRLREPDTKSLRFYVDPERNWPPSESTSDDGNLRAEIYEAYEFHTGDTVSWAPDKPLRSEEWMSWSYYYPPDFVSGETSSTKFMQAHAGHGAAPLDLRYWNPTEYPNTDGRCAGETCDEFVLHRLYPDDGEESDVAITDVKPEAGQWFDVVLHVVWDTESGGDGLTELWINGEKHYSSAGGNTFENPENKDHPYGAMLKLGIYHGSWREQEAIDASLDEGVDNVEVFLGPVRILSRPEGEHIGADGYDCVTPPTPRPTAD
ncbi:MAG: heparin lyase I family protein [Persicimonas sp.]